MIRFILIVIVVVFLYILAAPLFLIAWLIGLLSKDAQDAYTKVIVNIYFSILRFMTGAKIIYKGRENLIKDQAVLYVGNHQGFADIVFTYPEFPSSTGFIAKKEFDKIPLFAQAMTMIHCLFMDRSDIKQSLKVILAAIDKVKAGKSIFIFPEGTRSRNKEMADFKEGSLKIATKSGCPIIPVACSNTSAVFEDNYPRVKLANVIIEFGKPIDISALDKEELKHIGKYCHDIVEEMKKANDAEIEQMSR